MLSIGMGMSFGKFLFVKRKCQHLVFIFYLKRNGYNLLPRFSISSTCNLHELKYLDIKNRKVKCSIEREVCFHFFHINLFPNMLTNKLSAELLFLKILVRAKQRILDQKSSEGSFYSSFQMPPFPYYLAKCFSL